MQIIIVANAIPRPAEIINNPFLSLSLGGSLKNRTKDWSIPNNARRRNTVWYVTNKFILPTSSGKKSRVTIGTDKNPIAKLTQVGMENPINFFRKSLAKLFSVTIPVLSIFSISKNKADLQS